MKLFSGLLLIFAGLWAFAATIGFGFMVGFDLAAVFLDALGGNLP